MLDGVPDIASHPIRILFDNGVPVTINTDDLMIFGQSVSEEYRNLYRAGVFNAEELEKYSACVPYDCRNKGTASLHKGEMNCV